jgi:hypothetical protein
MNVVGLEVVSAMLQMLERMNRGRPGALIFETHFPSFKAQVVQATPSVNERCQVSHRKLNHRIEFRGLSLDPFLHSSIIPDSGDPWGDDGSITMVPQGWRAYPAVGGTQNPSSIGTYRRFRRAEVSQFARPGTR